MTGASEGYSSGSSLAPVRSSALIGGASVEPVRSRSPSPSLGCMRDGSQTTSGSPVFSSRTTSSAELYAQGLTLSPKVTRASTLNGTFVPSGRPGVSFTFSTPASSRYESRPRSAAFLSSVIPDAVSVSPPAQAARKAPAALAVSPGPGGPVFTGSDEAGADSALPLLSALSSSKRLYAPNPAAPTTAAPTPTTTAIRVRVARADAPDPARLRRWLPAICRAPSARPETISTLRQAH